jgi:L-lactate dehydrogenase complex protein LldG
MEKQTGSKQHILAQIRTALGRSASTVAPAPLPPFARPQASKEVAELAPQFSRELEKVGGSITCVQTVEEIREHFQRLFPADEFPSVAISNSEVLSQMGIREWLVADNRHIVPSVEKFLLARMKPSHEYSHDLLDATLGITTADYALADTGTLVLISGDEQHRLISLLPPVHVCFLDPSRIFGSLTELLAHLQVTHETHGLLPQALTCITGPSRSADIELTITMGVHGPRALHVILLPRSALPQESRAVLGHSQYHLR